MKKLFLMVFICMIMVSFCGCSKVIELTDEESYAIAEYAASLLIKYDRHLDSKYDEALEESAEDTTIDKKENLSPEEDIDITESVETTETTEKKNNANDTDSTVTEAVENTTESNKKDESGTTQSKNDSSENLNTSEGTVDDNEDLKPNVDKSYDIAEMVGLDNISIKYAYYVTLEQYPSYDKEGMYIEITAPEGYKLLVVKFDIENKTNETQNIDLFSYDLGYQMVVNEKKSAKQMLTILMDDLYTYQSEIGGSMRQEAVLLFQISDEIANELNTIKLKISKGDNTKIMQLQ